jgi:hypothetical protein
VVRQLRGLVKGGGEVFIVIRVRVSYSNREEGKGFN